LRDNGIRGLAVICCLLAAVTIGMAFAAFPLAFLDGTASFWRYPGGDAAEHIIGGRYFLATPWHLPLLFVPHLGLPRGSNIGLTDSIPIAAMVVKLATGAALAWSTCLPAWLLFCDTIQGPAAAVALYALGVRQPVPLLLGGLILVFTPVLMMRFGHAPLCGQFLLLLGLAIHFHAIRTRITPAAIAGYIALLPALLVHIYLFAMVFAIMCATLLHQLWIEHMTVRQVLAWLVVAALLVAATMGVCGYLSLGPIPLKAYGQSPLDLAAPFSPGPSLIFGMPRLP
jgi:hypothetical protein